MSDQQVRPAFLRVLQRCAEVMGLLVHRGRLRAGIAPRLTGTVVGTHSRESRNFFLYEVPVEGKITRAGGQNNCWATFACAVQVEAVSSNIDKLASWFRLVGGQGRERQKKNRCYAETHVG